jgi:hypothetical protein
VADNAAAIIDSNIPRIIEGGDCGIQNKEDAKATSGLVLFDAGDQEKDAGKWL